MFRRRLATLAAAAGLVLSCGCANTSNGGLFGNGGLLSRLRCGRAVEATPCCLEAGALGVAGEGPILVDRGPLLSESAVPVVPALPGACDSGLVPLAPSLAPAPRLVPQPLSQPKAYAP